MSFIGLKRFQRKYQKQKDEKLHKVTNIAFINLIQGSPVDLSNFRGSWLGSILTPRVGDANAFRGRGGVSVQSQRTTNPGVSKGQLPTAFEKRNLAPALKAKFGQDVYITNNLVYAKPLEDGHSGQAPSGILHVQAQRTRAQVNK